MDNTKLQELNDKNKQLSLNYRTLQ